MIQEILLSILILLIICFIRDIVSVIIFLALAACIIYIILLYND